MLLDEEVLKKLLDILIADEGLRLRPYKDSLGIWTVGIGRNLESRGFTPEEGIYLGIKGVKLIGKEIINYLTHAPLTKEQCMKLCENDIALCEVQLLKYFPPIRTLDHARQIVLFSMCFQMGLNGLLGFRNMLIAVEKDDYKLAACEMLNSTWAMQTPNRAQRLAKIMETGNL